MENGRLVFDNLKKVILYLLPAGSWSELWPVLVNVLLGTPLPLSAFLMIVICCMYVHNLKLMKIPIQITHAVFCFFNKKELTSSRRFPLRMKNLNRILCYENHTKHPGITL